MREIKTKERKKEMRRKTVHRTYIFFVHMYTDQAHCYSTLLLSVEWCLLLRQEPVSGDLGTRAAL